MEVVMFETLMKHGGHRVDYLNPSARGSRNSLAFYVCSDLPARAAYSIEAKRHLFAGLEYVQRVLGEQNLVAIYLDVNSPVAFERPAYEQMKRDLRDRYFRRLFVYSLYDLVSSEDMLDDLSDLYAQVGGFELISAAEGVDCSHTLDVFYSSYDADFWRLWSWQLQ